MAKIEVFVGSYTTDLGWVQGKGLGISSYQLDTETGALSLLSTIRTDNPSFLALHPSGNYLYANNEASHRVDSSDDSISAFAIAADGTLSLINQQASRGKAPCFVSVDLISQDAGTITAFAWDDDLGVLTNLQTASTVPADFSGEPAASEIQVHPEGQWLYASNRGHNSVVIFRIDAASGLLSLVGFQASLGITPRNFTLTPSGDMLLVANQDSDQIVVFRLDAATGLLSELDRQAVPTPVCMVCRPGSSRPRIAPG